MRTRSAIGKEAFKVMPETTSTQDKLDSYRIRRVQPWHIEEICKIEKASFSNPFSSDYLTELSLLHPDTFLVAETNDLVLGYAVGEIRHSQAHIISIAVRKGWRRRHVGPRLSESLVEIFREAGAKEVILEVRNSNSVARTMYERLGFKMAGKIDGYYEDGKEAIVYSLKLS